MDAAEADFDAKLYKASGDIIPELKAKIPKLIWHDGTKRRRIRTHVLMSKCYELTHLVRLSQSTDRILSSLHNPAGLISGMAPTPGSTPFPPHQRHRHWLPHLHHQARRRLHLPLHRHIPLST